jgi:glycine hydroxymethyltransferase
LYLFFLSAALLPPPHTHSQREVLANCQALNKALQAKGYNIVSGGTDNHLILVNVRDKGLDGSKVGRVQLTKLSLELKKL